MLPRSTASTSIPFGRWQARILLDRDNTLVPRDTEQVPTAVSAWLEAAHAKGFKLCMVSNNWHRDQVMASARELGLEAISHAMKPAPFALKRV
mgnify:FL=1